MREAGEVRVEQRRIDISLLPNPSHLEFVNPVVAGRVRALQTDQERSDAPADTGRALAITIHGDAAFPGQGVVAETLNLQSLAGYRVGGTLHVIANNQVGFTTDPHDSRSTRYSSDLAKGFDIPIIHVNADAVDACRSAVRLAMAFRERFGRDVLIDLVGYRRFGHNETDEPSYTQPLQVERIKAHPSVVTLYARRLIDDGLDRRGRGRRPPRADARAARGRAPPLRARRAAAEREPAERMARDLDQVDAHAPTGEELIALSDALLELPEGFTVHPKLGPQLERRRAADPRGRHRLGPRRVARVRLAAGRRHRDPPDRPGHRARHVLAPPPRAARRADGRALHADAAPRRLQGALRGAQLAALRGRVPRLRVRLLGHAAATRS